MSLFRKKPRNTAGSGCSLIDRNLTVRGDLDTDGTLRLDGRLEGSILHADTVLIGRDAVVQGDVSARLVVVAGTVHGALDVSERLELQPTAQILGDVTTPSLVVHEGAALRGRVTNGAATEDAPADGPRLAKMEEVA